MMQCAGCGNELQEGAIICRFCTRVVQFKTHFSPNDIDIPLIPVSPISKLHSIIRSDLFKPGIYLLVFCCLVLLANLGLASLERRQVIRNPWYTKIAFSQVSIDTLTQSDRVVISGRVTNLTNRNLQEVVVHAYVLNTLSQSIGEVYFQVDPEIVLPGSGSDFSISIPCHMDLVHRVKIEVFDAREQPEIKRPIKRS